MCTSSAWGQCNLQLWEPNFSGELFQEIPEAKLHHELHPVHIQPVQTCKGGAAKKKNIYIYMYTHTHIYIAFFDLTSSNKKLFALAHKGRIEWNNEKENCSLYWYWSHTLLEDLGWQLSKHGTLAEVRNWQKLVSFLDCPPWPNTQLLLTVYIIVRIIFSSIQL